MRSGYADTLVFMTTGPSAERASSRAPDAAGATDGSSARRRGGGVLGVTAICVAAGLLFGTSASLAKEHPLSGQATDLVGLITDRDQQVRTLSEEVDTLLAEVAVLQERVDTSQTRQLRQRADRVAPAVGMAPVSGPGLRVTLDDAGYSLSTLPEGYSVDDVVVHQQDLQGVVNALWAGGAEAIMVQDQRILSTSSIQCVGNTLYLQGRVYSPPYTVTAIGDPQALHAALGADPVVTTYRQWAEAIGLGYAVQDLAAIEIPAHTGTFRPRYASVPEDVPVVPIPDVD